jgi:hypothetical protein
MAADFQAEREAFQKFAKVLNEIEECKKLFEIAGAPLPEPLRRLLGTVNSGVKSSGPMVRITPVTRESRPSEFGENWLSVEIGEVSATSLVQAVLRTAKAPVKARDVIDLVTSVNPRFPRGSIHNIGTRLDNTLIRRTDEGWSLLHPEKAGIIHEGYMWGPREIFEKTELAAHRREAILHILKCFPGGLQTLQIVEQLKGASWVQAPSSKDLVKADMELLEAHGRVRRISNSRKWETIP